MTRTLFTDSQYKAIKHNKGPCLTLASPGSGKTLVITYRTKYLIENYGINPSNILVITFTRAAANEMKTRFNKLMDNSKCQVSFGTFHSIFFRILKYAYNYSADNILREDIKFQIIKEIIDGTELEIDDINEFCASIISEISALKGDMVDLNHYYSKNCSEDVFKKIYNEYDRKLRCLNKIDFDDMLILCYQLLSSRKDILSIWQKKFVYILIDEFQDINRIQYEIIKMLAAPQDNLFIVGDDDQSIYRFRGARPEIMLNFDKDFPETYKVFLDKNFRSGKKIVDASQRLIKINSKRFDKKASSALDINGDIEYRHFNDQNEENLCIVDEIRKYLKDGLNYSDIAILFRTNLGPRFLVEKLMEYNIPFHIKDAMPNIYEHWISKNIISYIKIALGNRDRNEFFQIMNRPKRYLSRNAFADSEVDFNNIYSFYSDKEWMIDRVSKMEYDLSMISKMTPYAAINYIRSDIGYDNYLREYADSRRMKVEELIDVADEIQEASKDFKSFMEWFDHIEDYTNELRQQAKKDNADNNMIELSTMHSSKGLEYRVVFIIDINEGVVPHNKAVLEEDMEEERRMFYVAVTRAKERLHLYYVKERFSKPVQISRFIGEMLYDFNEFEKNIEVVHKKYGKGIIKNIADGKMVIYFAKLKKELVFDVKYSVSSGIIQLSNV